MPGKQTERLRADPSVHLGVRLGVEGGGLELIPQVPE